jgi:rod shape determining protein RodA
VKNNFDRMLSSEDVMRRRATLLQRLHIDGPLLILLLTLAAGSLFVLYSASGKSWDLLAKQATSFGIGLVSMIVIAQFEPRFMARWVPVGYVLGVLLLVVVDVMGHNAMGATRWINIPGVIRFQPSEFMKILMPATIAWYLSKRTLPPQLKHVAVSLFLIGLPFILIVRQPDLGTSLLILAGGAFVLFMGGLKWRWIISVLAAAVPVAVAMWFFIMHDYQKNPDLPRPRERSAGHWLEHHSVQSCHRFRWRVWQGLAAGHPVAPGLPAGKPHRLHHCGHG